MSFNKVKLGLEPISQHIDTLKTNKENINISINTTNQEIKDSTDSKINKEKIRISEVIDKKLNAPLYEVEDGQISKLEKQLLELQKTNRILVNKLVKIKDEDDEIESITSNTISYQSHSNNSNKNASNNEFMISHVEALPLESWNINLSSTGHFTALNPKVSIIRYLNLSTGIFFVVGNDQGELKFFSVVDNKIHEKTTLMVHESSVTDILLAKDSNHIIYSSGYDGKLMQINLSNFSVTQIYKFLHPISKISYGYINLEKSAKNIYVASGSSVFQYNLTKDTIVNRHENIHEDKITSLVYSEVKNVLITSSKDGIIKIWNESFENVGVLEGHAGPIRDLAVADMVTYHKNFESRKNFFEASKFEKGFNSKLNELVSIVNEQTKKPEDSIAKNTVMASIGEDMVVTFWNLDDKDKTISYDIMNKENYDIFAKTDLKFTPEKIVYLNDGQSFLILNSNGIYNFFNYLTGECKTEIIGNESFTSLCYLGNGKNILFGSDDGCIQLYSVDEN